MGYTHYWRFKKTKSMALENERRYQRAIKKINIIAQFYQNSVPKGSDERLSGYTAYTSKYGGIHVNGSRGNDHEDFCLREHFSENRDFEFCKTARKPYDVVVVAALIVLSHYLKHFIEVSSDGYPSDWQDGLALAKEATGLNSLKIPRTIYPVEEIGEVS